MKNQLHCVLVLFFLISQLQLFCQWSTNPAINNPVCKYADEQKSPAIVSDGNGGAIIAWEDQRNGGSIFNSAIYTQHINASGAVQWASDGIMVCNNSNSNTLPSIVSDGAGGAIITWVDCINGGKIYAQRVSASGNLLWQNNGVLVSSTASCSGFVTISDGSNGVVICWSDDRNTDKDIYAQRIDGNGLFQWTNNGIAICTAVNHQQYPSIISNSNGEIIISWEDLRIGGTYYEDIYAQCISTNGTIKWQNNGVLVSSTINGQTNLNMAPDNNGGVIIVWEDYNINTNQIFAQHINSTGVVQWMSNGVAISNSGVGYNVSPSIINNGNSEYIISWEFNFGSIEVKMQKINSTGATQWQSGGIKISSGHSSQMVSDGKSGAIIAWQDTPPSSQFYNIYWQRINSNGQEMWTGSATYGKGISTAPNDQQRPKIISDGVSGAIFTWVDSRNGSSDIYAQRIDSTGSPLSIGIYTYYRNDFSIYPNPNNGKFTIENTELIKQITITDITGKVLLQQTINQQKTEIDLSSLSKGIYFFNATLENNQTIIKKIITQ